MIPSQDKCCIRLSLENKIMLETFWECVKSGGGPANTSNTSAPYLHTRKKFAETYNEGLLLKVLYQVLQQRAQIWQFNRAWIFIDTETPSQD
jgi:hypothetical protein